MWRKWVCAWCVSGLHIPSLAAPNHGGKCLSTHQIMLNWFWLRWIITRILADPKHLKHAKPFDVWLSKEQDRMM